MLYSISGIPAEASKRDIARELLKLRGGALSVQVLHEFYAQSTRVGGFGLSHQTACETMQLWRRFKIQPMTLSLFNQALEIKASSGYSIWDATVISAAMIMGCDTLYTEDLSHGWRLGGLQVVNPFR